jgi:hypothetical protein
MYSLFHVALFLLCSDIILSILFKLPQSLFFPEHDMHSEHSLLGYNTV